VHLFSFYFGSATGLAQVTRHLPSARSTLLAKVLSRFIGAAPLITSILV